MNKIEEESQPKKVVVPYKDRVESKKKQVEDMFDQVSSRYDTINRILSFRIDVSWRKRVIDMLREHNPQVILDVATGTADLAIAEAELKPKKIVGIDLSEGMLKVGRVKVAKMGLQDLISLQQGDSEAINFAANTFHAATVSFGVRNFENLKQGISEIHRVLAPNGVLIVLEFSLPKKSLFRTMYMFYSKRILPTIGRIVSGSKEAYTYLPESIKVFPYGQKFADVLTECGFTKVSWEEQSRGIATIYQAFKEG